MNPGFWAIMLSTEIATDITVKKVNDSDNKTIYVKASDTFQTGVEGNWSSVMNRALRNYISEVKAKVQMKQQKRECRRRKSAIIAVRCASTERVVSGSSLSCL